MQSIFKELYNGEISPETKDYSKNQDYKKALNAQIGYRDKLTVTFDNYQKELLDSYTESRNILESIVNFETFSYGLSLGIKLITEALANGNKITDGIKITIESEVQEKCMKL